MGDSATKPVTSPPTPTRARRQTRLLKHGYYFGLTISFILLLSSLFTFQQLFSQSSLSIDKLVEKLPALRTTSDSKSVLQAAQNNSASNTTLHESAKQSVAGQTNDNDIKALEATSRVLLSAMAARVAMANNSLSLCGIYLGLSFAFLGTSLFLLGFHQTMDINGSGNFETPSTGTTIAPQVNWSLQILRMSPGAFAFLCATIVVSLSVTSRAKLTLGEVLPESASENRSNVIGSATNANPPISGQGPTTNMGPNSTSGSYWAAAPAACAPTTAPAPGGYITIPIKIDAQYLQLQSIPTLQLVPETDTSGVSKDSPKPPLESDK